MSELPAASGEVADTSQNQNKGAVTLADLSPEQNEELTKLLARKEKEWEKKNKTAFDKAGEFDRLQSELKQKQESELSEVEKLKKQLAEFSPITEKLKSYEDYIAKQFEELSSELSEEDKETLEALSVPITEKLALAKRLIVKPQANANGAARASASVTKSADALLEKATKMADEVCQGKSEEYRKKFIERQYESLKLQQHGFKTEDVDK